MMSLILLINGIFNILMSLLFFFYTNKYRDYFNDVRMILYSTFSLYFLFIGFLRIRVALEENKWFEGLEYSYTTVFSIASNITAVVVITFLYLSISFKGKIIKNDEHSKTMD